MDIIGRILAPRMLDSLGQPMIVDNRAGAGGNLGTAAAAKSVPDGYTVVLGALGPLVQNAVLYASATFDPVRDFAAISLVATGPILMAVHPSIPVKNLKELVELAKRRPGQISYGSGGHRQRDTYRRRNDQIRNGHRHASCSVSRQCRVHHRHDHRTSQHGL